jgi:hypothetical protein
MYDSVNAIDRSYAPYFADVHGSRGASEEAAAAQAGHDTAVVLYPQQQAAFDAELAADLAGIPPGQAKQGIEIGQAVAQQILALRSAKVVEKAARLVAKIRHLVENPRRTDLVVASPQMPRPDSEYRAWPGPAGDECD